MTYLQATEFLGSPRVRASGTHSQCQLLIEVTVIDTPVPSDVDGVSACDDRNGGGGEVYRLNITRTGNTVPACLLYLLHRCDLARDTQCTHLHSLGVQVFSISHQKCQG